MPRNGLQMVSKERANGRKKRQTVRAALRAWGQGGAMATLGPDPSADGLTPGVLYALARVQRWAKRKGAAARRGWPYAAFQSIDPLKHEVGTQGVTTHTPGCLP